MYALGVRALEEPGGSRNYVDVSLRSPEILIAVNSSTHCGMKRGTDLRERCQRIACKIHTGLLAGCAPAESVSGGSVLRMSGPELVMMRRILVVMGAGEASRPSKLVVDLRALLHGVGGRSRRARSSR